MKLDRDFWIDAAWLLAFGLASTLALRDLAYRVGATFDEPFYAAAGLECWRTGSTKVLMTKGTMPLPVDAVTLPLYAWERWRGVPFTPYVDLPVQLPIMRAGTLAFWWLLLFYGMRAGRTAGGPWAGRLAVGLLATDPNLLAHAALATTDIAISACVLAAGYHWLRGRDSRSWWRIVVPGFWFGIALTAKASAMAFVPLIWATHGLCHLHATGVLAPAWTGSPRDRVRNLWAITSRLRWDFLYAGLIGYAWLFAYCGCDWQREATFVDWAEKLPEGSLKSAMTTAANSLPVFTNAGEGLMQQVKHNLRGHHGAFALGRYHDHSVWYYFPVTLAAKLPESTLLLLAVSLAFRPRQLANPYAWAALALLAFSLNARVQIGIRLMLPLVVHLLVALAIACTAPGPRRRFSLPLGFAAIAWSAFAVTDAWPDPLRYVNRLHGGTDRGYEVVAESNYDWGQGLPELKEWATANGYGPDRPLAVWFYGADPAIILPPFRHVPLLGLPSPRTPDKVREAVGPDGVLAIGYSLLTVCPDRKPDALEMLAWLKDQEVIARTRTFAIVRLR